MTVVTAETAPLLHRLLAGRDPAALTHVELLPARAGQPADWPAWAPSRLRRAFAGRGIDRPWRHQVTAAEHAYAGRHVVIATGTASGKSLAYQLPVLARLLAEPRATALYLSPTKALAADQGRTLTELDMPDLRVATFDGDTPRDQREWVRQYARLVLTNPDMLHHGVLPRHSTWSTFLRRLAYVVVDECHAYRGVFGSHVAHVLRRLRRVAAKYGGEPVFVLASATAADPATTAGRLIGAQVTAVTGDTSPRGGMAFALWDPPRAEVAPAGVTDPEVAPAAVTDPEVAHAAVTDPEVAHAEVADAVSGGRLPGQRRVGPARRSVVRETAGLLADAVSAGIRTLAFVRSRQAAEAVAATARTLLADADLADRVAAYRAGYLAEDRRALERALLDGTLLGLAATNALELGVDLAGLDAVIMAGYPGRIASMWQQAGRAGRAGRAALCVLVARDDPLDRYLVRHPAALFSRPVEACVLDPANPHVLGPHLVAAAAELPLRPGELDLFGNVADGSGPVGADGSGPAGGSAAVRAALAGLVADGTLRRRPSGWYRTGDGHPEVDLRGTGGGPVAVVEVSTGRLLGTVDHGSAHLLVHPGAVYVHQGSTYVVESMDLADPVALVRADEPPWTTHPRESGSLTVESVRSYVDAGPVGLFLGEVTVTAQVVGYQRRAAGTGAVLDTVPLDLPARNTRTVAVWWTVSDRALADAGVDRPDVPGALHAAEHAAIGLLPLVATCDRWDIGGISTARHPDTDAPTVFVYDGPAGGAGFAERAYAATSEWLTATRNAIADCGCRNGCPSCVQSPKCGHGNSPLSKNGAMRSLDVVLTHLDRD